MTQTEPKGGTQMELSACIVVYNGAGEAIRAAQTVLDCTRRYPLTLYLVDNASPDGSGGQLTAAAKDGTLRTAPGQTVQVLCRLENGGFGTGHNTVLSLLHSRVHFILNPDIQLTADTLSDLADWMAAHPGVVMTRPGLT
ncbi:MAG: glycosyltransferase, partial [Faecalibacterium prausnitzii]|nr:glycosyltransferase [Faecalibacterium prausnitzii]